MENNKSKKNNIKIKKEISYLEAQTAREKAGKAKEIKETQKLQKEIEEIKLKSEVDIRTKETYILLNKIFVLKDVMGSTYGQGMFEGGGIGSQKLFEKNEEDFELRQKMLELIKKL